MTGNGSGYPGMKPSILSPKNWSQREKNTAPAQSSFPTCTMGRRNTGFPSGRRCGGWGASSCDAAWLMAHVVAGYSTSGADYSASWAADMLANAKVIVLWGFDPTVTHHGPAHQFAWFIKLAKEKGRPSSSLNRVQQRRRYAG